MNKENPILEVRNLSAGYGRTPVLKGISFSLYPAEILCLVGESGSGKSTLLKAILGSDAALTVTGGEIILKGVSLRTLSPKQRKAACLEAMGMVYQNPGSSFNPIRSYRKQFIETLKSHGLYNPADFFSRTEAVFDRLGLPDAEKLLSLCPYEMSGGMNQRIALALTLLLKQDILLGDEPTSALDTIIQLQVADELKKLKVHSGVSQIIVTHNLALAAWLGDRIGVMKNGELIETGTAREITTRPVYAYTKSLLAAIPSLDGKMPSVGDIEENSDSSVNEAPI